MTSASIADIAKACFEAYTAKDRDAAESLIAPNFHFTSVLDDHIDRETYFARFWSAKRCGSSIAFNAIAERGDRVYICYECLDGAHSSRSTEIYTIRDGRVVAVEVCAGWILPRGGRQSDRATIH
jgi:hypothetical protein